MARGMSVCGYWSIWPGTGNEPKRFTTKEDALQGWPEVRVDSVYAPLMVVFRVTWEMDSDAILTGGKYVWPERGGEIQRSDFVSLENPLSYDGFCEAVEDLKAAALEKKNAKKAAKPGDARHEKTLANLDAITKAREVKNAQRKSYAKNRSYKKRVNP